MGCRWRRCLWAPASRSLVGKCFGDHTLARSGSGHVTHPCLCRGEDGTSLRRTCSPYSDWWSPYIHGCCCCTQSLTAQTKLAPSLVAVLPPSTSGALPCLESRRFLPSKQHSSTQQP